MLFNYTTTLQDVVESYPVNADVALSHKQVIENGRSQLFDFDYPIFDESYRNVFETNFIRNFYVRQIGFETVGLFKFQLETWLLINMPYFNKMFESELLEFDPLINLKMTESKKRNEIRKQDDQKIQDKNATADTDSTVKKDQTLTATNNVIGETLGDNESVGKSSMTGDNVADAKNTSTNTNTSDKFNRDLSSNTPDSRLSITTQDGKGVIEYASEIKEKVEKDSNTSNATNNTLSRENSSVNSDSKTTDKTKVNNTVNENLENVEASNTLLNHKVTHKDLQTDTLSSLVDHKDEYALERMGKVGNDSFSKMLLEYRQTFLKVEKIIFNEMNELFMTVY